MIDTAVLFKNEPHLKDAWMSGLEVEPLGMADSSCYRIRATLTALIKAVFPSTGNVKVNKSSPVSTVNDSYTRLNSMRH